VNLPAARSAWPPEAIAEFEERAGIVEHDGGLLRDRAEALAERLVRNAWVLRGGEGA
jgi:hypothetical protein